MSSLGKSEHRLEILFDHHFLNLSRYLTGLETRLEKVEQRLDSLDDRSDTIPRSPLQLGSSTAHSRHLRLDSMPSSYDDVQEIGNEDSTDGMGAISFTDEQDSGFFGELRRSDLGRND